MTIHDFLSLVYYRTAQFMLSCIAVLFIASFGMRCLAKNAEKRNDTTTTGKAVKHNSIISEKNKRVGFLCVIIAE